MSLTAAGGEYSRNLEYLTILLHNRGSAHLCLDQVSMLFAHIKYKYTVSQAIYVLSLVSKACLFLVLFFLNYACVWIYIIPKEPTITECSFTVNPLGYHTGDFLTSLHSPLANQSLWGSLESTSWR